MARTGKRRKFHIALHGVYMIISPKAENNAQKIASEQIGREKRKLRSVKASALRVLKGRRGCALFYRIEHVLDENTVSARGIRYKDVRYGADKLSVLDDRAAAHPLDNTSGEFKELFVGHRYREILR